MKKIRSTNSKAEVLLRKKLWKEGYRYRLSNHKIIGKPDIVFTKRRLAIFVDGDFWHGFDWSNKKKKLKANAKYWIPKIERNIQRDLEVTTFLKQQGWSVIRFWEHEILNGVEHCMVKIKEKLVSDSV